MRDGRIEQVGAPVEIYYRPASAFVAEFFSEVNRMPGRVGGGFVQTPLGPVRAGGIPDGTTVQVLVRPEGIRPDVPGPGPTAPPLAGPQDALVGKGGSTRVDLGGGTT